MKKVLILTGILGVFLLESKGENITELTKEYNEKCVYRDSKDFYSDAYRGWFYKEECEKLEKKFLEAKMKNTQGMSQVPPTDTNLSSKEDQFLEKIKSNLDNLEFWKKNTVYRWLRNDENLGKIDQKTFKEVLDRVIYYASLDHKNQEKISTAVYMIDYSRRKSMDFTHSYTEYILKNPKYNIASKMGKGNYEYQFTREVINKNINNELNKYKDEYSLVMFGSSKCEYCIDQKRILKMLKDELNYNIAVVSIDECGPFLELTRDCTVNPTAFSFFNVEITPTIFMYYKNTKKFEIVSVGLENKADLKNKIFSTLYKLKTGKNLNFAETTGEIK